MRLQDLKQEGYQESSLRALLSDVPIGEGNAMSSREIWLKHDCWTQTTVRRMLKHLASRGAISIKIQAHQATGWYYIFWRNTPELDHRSNEGPDVCSCRDLKLLNLVPGAATGGSMAMDRGGQAQNDASMISDSSPVIQSRSLPRALRPG